MRSTSISPLALSTSSLEEDDAIGEGQNGGSCSDLGVRRSQKTCVIG